MRRFLSILLLLAGALHAETTLVLPFFNHSGNASLGWIGESIAETVHDALASEGLLALDREDRVEAYRRLSLRPGAELTHASIIKVGDALDATKLVYGFYELLPQENGQTPSKGSLRVTARVMDLKTASQSAPISETGALEDLAIIEARLGWQALQLAHPNPSLTLDEFLKARPPIRLDAVENYIRGLMADVPEQRHRYFTQAARLDGKFSQPCFQLGKTYWERSDYRVAAGWLERVTRTDPRYLEARFFLGLCRYHTGDFRGAADAFQEVSDSVPLNEVFNNLGAARLQLNDVPTAVANFQKAIEGDDAEPDFYFNLAYAYWRAGQYPKAQECFRAATERNPNDAEATTMLGFTLRNTPPRQGDPKHEGRQRLKSTYEEAAYRQLRAELAK